MILTNEWLPKGASLIGQGRIFMIFVVKSSRVKSQIALSKSKCHEDFTIIWTLIIIILWRADNLTSNAAQCIAILHQMLSTWYSIRLISKRNETTRSEESTVLYLKLTNKIGVGIRKACRFCASSENKSKTYSTKDSIFSIKFSHLFSPF